MSQGSNVMENLQERRKTAHVPRGEIYILSLGRFFVYEMTGVKMRFLVTVGENIPEEWKILLSRGSVT